MVYGGSEKRTKVNRFSYLSEWVAGRCLCECLCRKSIRKWENALYLINIVLVRTICYSANLQPPAFDKSDQIGKQKQRAQE